MATQRSTAKVQVEGLQETLRAFNKLEKQASNELRDAAQQVANETADAARARGTGLSDMQSLAASSIVAKRDRVPKVQGGGSKKVGKRGHKVGGFFMGAEFGGGSRPETSQFPAHQGQEGYFLWPTIRARADDDARIYMKHVDELLRKWARD